LGDGVNKVNEGGRRRRKLKSGGVEGEDGEREKSLGREWTVRSWSGPEKRTGGTEAAAHLLLMGLLKQLRARRCLGGLRSCVWGGGLKIKMKDNFTYILTWNQWRTDLCRTQEHSSRKKTMDNRRLWTKLGA
jgi:hypothetical protein